jgi:hypothetical protein
MADVDFSDLIPRPKSEMGKVMSDVSGPSSTQDGKRYEYGLPRPVLTNAPDFIHTPAIPEYMKPGYQAAQKKDVDFSDLIPKEQPKKQGFFEALTEGGWQGIVKENIGAVLYERMQDLNAASDHMKNNDEWNKEIARRKQAGEPIDQERMEKWRVNRLEEIIRQGKPDYRPESFGDLVQQTVRAAVDNPKGMAGKLLRGLATSPELTVLPEFLPLKAAGIVAKVGKTAATAAKAGTEAAQMATAAGAESVMRQRVEHGQVSGSQTALDAVMSSVAPMGVRALFPRAKMQAGIATEYALTKAAKEKGIEPSTELIRQTVEDIEKRVSNGQALEAAAKDAFEAVKVSPEAAADAAEMLKPPEEKGAPDATEAGKVQKDDLGEHPRTGPPRVEEAQSQADRGDRPSAGSEVGKEAQTRVEPAKPETEPKPVEPTAQVIRPKQFQPPPEPPDRFTREIPMTPEMEKAAERQFSDNEKAKQNLGPERAARLEQLSQKLEKNEPMSQSEKNDYRRLLKAWEKEAVKLAAKRQAEQHAQKVTKLEPLPKEVPNRFATAEEARTVYEMAGIDKETAAKMADKPIAMGALRQRLSKFMDGQQYADKVLIDAFREGKLPSNPESGKIDPVMAKVLGISALGGVVAYMYNHDPKDTIAGALATGGVILAAAALRKGGRAVAETTKFWDQRYRLTDAVETMLRAKASGEVMTTRFMHQIMAMVGKEKDRIAITHYLQGDESIRMTPEMMAVANTVRQFTKDVFENANKAGVIEHARENYVTQLWSGLNKNQSLFRNLLQALGKSNTFSAGMSPRSRFNFERVIPSYKEGMKMGLIPATLDIAKIVKIYTDNVNAAIANKNFLAALKRERMPDGTRVLAPADEIRKEIVQTALRTEDQWKAKGPIADDIVRFAQRKVKDDYVLMTNPNMIGMVAHKDIVPQLNALFAASSPNAVEKALYATSIAAKRGLFSFSFFHAMALSQAALGAPLGMWKHLVWNPETGWFEASKLLKQGVAGDVLDRLVQGGLKVLEHPLEGDITPMTKALELINAKYPIIGAPAKGISIVQKGMNYFLWNIVQPTFKVATAMAALEKTTKDAKKPSLGMKAMDAALGERSKNLTDHEAAKAAASFTNDIFGSIDWYRIADGVQNRLGRDLALAIVSPRGKMWMQILALAPDWTVATARSFAKAIPGISSREIAALHQGYIFKQAILYAVIADGLNMQFSGHHFWENDDPTMVDMGDGRKLQVSKHFMEPFRWLLHPGQEALNKLGYLPKEVLDQVFNKKYLSTKGAPPITESKDSLLAGTGKRIEHAAGGVAPITGQQLLGAGAIPSFSGFFGVPIYGKTDVQYEEAAKERAIESGKTETEAAASAKRARDRRERARKKSELEREKRLSQ